MFWGAGKREDVDEDNEKEFHVLFVKTIRLKNKGVPMKFTIWGNINCIPQIANQEEINIFTIICLKTKKYVTFLFDKDSLHIGQGDVGLLGSPSRCFIHYEREVLVCVLSVGRQEILDT